jgi:cytochrome c biogenesis protein CcdA
MLAVLTLILSIGLADSIDPAMIIPALYFAASPRGARGVAGFACGVFVVNLVGGVAIALGPGRFLLDLAPHPAPPVTHALELAVGGLLLVAAVLLWRLPRQSDQPRGDHERLRHAAPLVGATVALAELPTAVPYFVIIAAVVRSDAGVASTIALLAAYQLIYLAPVLAISVLTERTARSHEAWRGESIRAFVARYQNRLIATILFVAALVLLALGAYGITAT